MEDKITEFFNKLGVSSTETKIYLMLLRLGPSSIASLTKESKIPRTTLRENLERLISKGLVSQTVRSSKKLLIAEDPDKAKLLLVEKKLDVEVAKKHLEEVEKGFPDFLKQITKSIPQQSKGSDVTVKFYEGKQDVHAVYLQIMSADKVYSFAHLERYYEVYPDMIDLWVSALKNNPKREVWDILLDSPVDQSMGKQHEYDRYYTKILHKPDAEDKFVFADIIVFDNSVAIINLNPGHLHATVIVSDHISETIKALHQTLWGLI